MTINPKAKQGRIYKCRQCGKIETMELEIGLCEPGKNYKPVPFAIRCECGGYMTHQYMHDYRYVDEIYIDEHSSYFANSQYSNFGIPIIRKRPKSKREVYEESILVKHSQYLELHASRAFPELANSAKWIIGKDVALALFDDYICQPQVWSAKRIKFGFMFGIPVYINYDNKESIRLILEVGAQE